MTGAPANLDGVLRLLHRPVQPGAGEGGDRAEQQPHERTEGQVESVFFGEVGTVGSDGPCTTATRTGTHPATSSRAAARASGTPRRSRWRSAAPGWATVGDRHVQQDRLRNGRHLDLAGQLGGCQIQSLAVHDAGGELCATRQLRVGADPPLGELAALEDGRGRGGIVGGDEELRRRRVQRRHQQADAQGCHGADDQAHDGQPPTRPQGRDNVPELHPDSPFICTLHAPRGDSLDLHDR